MNLASRTSFPRRTSGVMQTYSAPGTLPFGLANFDSNFLLWVGRAVSGRSCRSRRDPDLSSASAFSHDDCSWGGKQNLDVGPDRHLSGVAQIEANHLVERRAASSCHLPQACNTRLCLENAAAVP